jgi:hypothetical protein
VKIDMQIASKLADEFKNNFTVSASGQPAYIIRLTNGLKVSEVVSRLAKVL